jgi:hypothetical protein
LRGAPGRAFDAPPFLLKIIFIDNLFEIIRSRGMVFPVVESKARLTAPRESDRFRALRGSDRATRSKRRRAKDSSRPRHGF